MAKISDFLDFSINSYEQKSSSRRFYWPYLILLVETNIFINLIRDEINKRWNFIPFDNVFFFLVNYWHGLQGGRLTLVIKCPSKKKMVYRGKKYEETYNFKSVKSYH